MGSELDLYNKLFTKSIDGGKFNNLMDFILDERNLYVAHRKLYTTEPVEDRLELYRDKIMSLNIRPDDIKTKPYIGLDGREKTVSVNNNFDLVIQHAVRQILYPIVEAKLHHNNYGNRDVRNFKHAVANIAQRLNLGKLHWVFNIEFDQFTVDKNTLVKILRSTFGIRDEKLLVLISNTILHLDDFSILKSFFINVYLNDFDWWFSNQWDTIKGHDENPRKDQFLHKLKKKNLKRGYFVRYGSDILVLSDDRNTSEKWFHAIREYFSVRLKLSIDVNIRNLRKKRVDFIGYSFWMAKKSNKWIMFSDISPNARKFVQYQLTKFIKVTSQKGTPMAAKIYNMNVKRMHNYYGMATNSNRTFNSIWNRTRDSYYNSFKHLSTSKQMSSIIKSIKKTEYYDVVKKYRTYHIQCHSIGNIPLIPICCVIHEKPMNISYDTKPFTYLN